MKTSILTVRQRDFLSFFGRDKALRRAFYFTGGTCLAEHYLRHRVSEDLDFFSVEEFDIKEVFVMLFKINKQMKIKKTDFRQSFNRNIFHLIWNEKDKLKVEFTFFPFGQIEKTKKINGVKIDSLKDLAVNKLFTILQNPRGRDYFDLYEIIKKKKWKIEELAKLARIKFDFQIDKLQLGKNFLKADSFKDDPILQEGKENFEEINRYFEKEAKSLAEKTVK